MEAQKTELTEILALRKQEFDAVERQLQADIAELRELMRHALPSR